MALFLIFLLFLFVRSKCNFYLEPIQPSVSVCNLDPLYLFEPSGDLEIGPLECNRNFPSTLFLEPPLVLFNDAKLGSNYTLIFIGNNILLQWLVDNIPSCAFYGGNMLRFNQAAGYVAPMPINSPTIYQMLLYEQNVQNQFRFIEFNRIQFNLAKFVADAQLSGPVGGMQFGSFQTIVAI